MEDSWLTQVISFLEKYRLPLILSVAGLGLIAVGLLVPQANLLPSQKKIVVDHPNSSASQNQGQNIEVAVSGAVNKPGLYQLPTGARVNDLILNADGLSEQVDQNWFDKNVNLAQVLADGQKVYISKVGDQTVLDSSVLGTQTQGITKLININTATAAELDTLPGVGMVTAQKIIAARPYKSLDELVSKKAVGNATFEKIKDKISVF